ncbi:MAG: SDR family NAD(P)-dependent oxidoreductase, partial [Proteobacteria bacterium]
PVKCDIRNENDITEAIEKGAQHFGGIDILVNNASAISLTPTERTETKRFDLMHDVNVRGTFLVSRECIPHLKKGKNPHILTLSPPVNLDKKWFASHLAYTLSKYNMTMIAMGLAEELKAYGKDIYSAEPGNMNCRFTSGEIAIIMLKIAPRPYMSVEFILPGARRDYSAFAGLRPEAKPVKGFQKVPLEPSSDPYFTMPAPSEPAVASETKRDWNTFRSAFGKGK